VADRRERRVVMLVALLVLTGILAALRYHFDALHEAVHRERIACVYLRDVVVPARYQVVPLEDGSRWRMEVPATRYRVLDCGGHIVHRHVPGRYNDDEGGTR
jgi:hypothetical protein